MIEARSPTMPAPAMAGEPAGVKAGSLAPTDKSNPTMLTISVLSFICLCC
jgi:hypothetical protein